ncbi:unnamed protein product [Prorocentrum cordatum]|uniref:Glycosyl hydrolase family 81 N-terminal domain-containing protein n=1 Tax=Prorocentrum cordatum TaxID=2364126 RepID=A0ABN9V496_9DINO|nr:unnamed protein product [Polarella glacialis]
MASAPQLPRARHPLAPLRVGSKLKGRPLHTNKFFSSLFLSDGSSPLYAHPYVLRVRKPESAAPYRLEVSYSAARRTVAEAGADGRAEFYHHAFEADVALGAAEAGSEWEVEDVDDAGLGVVIAFGRGQWRAPIVRGMPYVTGVFDAQTPLLSSTQTIVSIDGRPVQVGAEFVGARLRLQLGNGQCWRLYGLSQPAPAWTWDGQALRCKAPVRGAVRVALEPGGAAEAGEILDRHCRAWAEGADVRLSPPRGYSIAWRRAGDAGGPALLQCAELHHLDALVAEGGLPQGARTALRFESTTKGPLRAVAADIWALRVDPVEVGWLPESGPQTLRSWARSGGSCGRTSP